MYFVVYIVELKKTLILPSTWIENIDDHIEKFMNRSLNTAQSFLCFYTNDQNAFEANGEPKLDYPVDFSLQSRDDLDGPGCFVAKLKQFKLLYEDAVDYMNRRRNIEPAIYNEARLLEMPIPELHQIEEVTVHDDNNGSIGADLAVSTPQGGNATPIDALSVEPANTNQYEPENQIEPQNTNQDEPEDTQEFRQIEQKSNIPLLGLRVANNNNILNLMEDEDDDDDVEIISFEGEQFKMIVGPKGFALPMVLLPDKRIKRENDEISGSEPYYVDEKKDRVYKIGDSLVEFPNILIEKLLGWNKPPRNTDRYYDKRFTRSLLMSIVSEDRLADSKVSDDEKQFIYRLLQIRCKGDMDRLDKLDGYINELCEENKMAKQK